MSPSRPALFRTSLALWRALLQTKAGYELMLCLCILYIYLSWVFAALSSFFVVA